MMELAVFRRLAVFVSKNCNAPEASAPAFSAKVPVKTLVL